MNTTAPTKLSEWLDAAQEDALSILADARYCLNMKVWHSPSAGICHLCLAGAVLAKSLGAFIGDDIGPGELSDENAKGLEALERVRRGWLETCVRHYYGDATATMLTPLITNIYKTNPVLAPLCGVVNADQLNNFFESGVVKQFRALLAERGL